MKTKKSLFVLIVAAGLAAFALAGCDCDKKKHHGKKCKDQTCQKCQCNPNANDNGTVVVTEEDAIFAVPANAPAQTPANNATQQSPAQGPVQQ